MGWSNDQFIGELTIPTGATTGARITINKDNDGAIKVYDASNVLIAEISATADVIKALDANGVFAKLDPAAASFIADTPGPGLVLGGMSGDVFAGSLTEYDDTFTRGLYLRTPSPDPLVPVDPIEGIDYASIRLSGRFHGNDPQIQLSAGSDPDAPAGFVAINGVTFGADNQIQSYGGPTVFSPAVGSTGGATFSTRTGWWYRVGPMVFFTGYAIASGAGSGAGLVQMTTPTTIDRTTRQRIGMHISGVSGGPGSGEYTGLCLTGGTATTIDRITRGGVDLTGANIAIGTTFTIEGWYREEV